MKLFIHRYKPLAYAIDLLAGVVLLATSAMIVVIGHKLFVGDDTGDGWGHTHRHIYSGSFVFTLGIGLAITTVVAVISTAFWIDELK